MFDTNANILYEENGYCVFCSKWNFHSDVWTGIFILLAFKRLYWMHSILPICRALARSFYLLYISFLIIECVALTKKINQYIKLCIMYEYFFFSYFKMHQYIQLKLHSGIKYLYFQFYSMYPENESLSLLTQYLLQGHYSLK